MKRHPDGTWRNTRRPLVVAGRVRRARWIEAETIHLKRMGFSFEAIAEHLNRVARGHEQPAVALPENVTFPPDYTISRQACHKACRAAIAREPALEVGALRKIDHARSEEMFLNLQPAIRKGNPRAIETGIKVLNHEAKINGYAAPQRHEITTKHDDGRVPIQLVQDMLRRTDEIKARTAKEGKSIDLDTAIDMAVTELGRSWFEKWTL